jgi:hypothetical protein
MKRFAMAALAAFFVCGVLVAQAKEIVLTETQSMRLELAIRRANDALKDLELIKAQFDKRQAEYPELQKASTAIFNAICKEAKVDPQKYQMSADFKKLLLKDDKK